MAFRLVPGTDITQNVREIGTEQIDRSLKKFSGKSNKTKAVHETRKSMKRLRALLHLIKPAMRKSDFRRDEARLKAIARSLSGARDMQAMSETVVKLEACEDIRVSPTVAKKLRAHLEARRDDAEKNLTGATTTQTRQMLREARKDFAQLALQQDDFDLLSQTIKADYRKARRAFRHAYQSGHDEAFHDWRKYVQRHWRQLLLVAPSWPRALRPHIALAKDLSEVLGEDHDLSVLADYIESQEPDLGSQKDVDAFLQACRARQAQLRDIAHDMGSRLLAEKPSSLAARLRTYWHTAPRLQERNDAEEKNEPTNVIPLTR